MLFSIRIMNAGFRRPFENDDFKEALSYTVTNVYNFYILVTQCQR